MKRLFKSWSNFSRFALFISAACILTAVCELYKLEDSVSYSNSNFILLILLFLVILISLIISLIYDRSMK